MTENMKDYTYIKLLGCFIRNSAHRYHYQRMETNSPQPSDLLIQPPSTQNCYKLQPIQSVINQLPVIKQIPACLPGQNTHATTHPRPQAGPWVSTSFTTVATI